MLFSFKPWSWKKLINRSLSSVELGDQNEMLSHPVTIEKPNKKKRDSSFLANTQQWKTMDGLCLLYLSQLLFPLYESVFFPFPCGDLYVAHQKRLVVKNLPAVQETWVLFLGWEDPLEESMATHCSNLACEIPWTEDAGGLNSMGSQRIRHDWRNLHTLTHLGCRSWTEILFCCCLFCKSHPLFFLQGIFLTKGWNLRVLC